MKQLIFAVSALLLLVSTWYFSRCMNIYNQQNDKLRWVASEAAAAGALYIDKEEESVGRVHYVDVEALKAVDKVIEKNLYLNANYEPQTGAYWQETASVTVYILDDISCRVYKNGALIETYAFSYPYLLHVSGTSYSHSVAYPTVAVSIDVGSRKIGGGLLQAVTHTIRTSAYERIKSR